MPKVASFGKSFVFADKSCNMLNGNGRLIATATKSGNLYHLNCSPTQTANAIVQKCASGEETRENLWHRRFGHLGAGNLEKLARGELVSGFDYYTSKKHFVNHVLMENLIGYHFQRKEEKEQKIFFHWCTMMSVKKSR